MEGLAPFRNLDDVHFSAFLKESSWAQLFEVIPNYSIVPLLYYIKLSSFLLHFLLSNLAFLILITRALLLLLSPCYLSSALSFTRQRSVTWEKLWRLKPSIASLQRCIGILHVKAQLTAVGRGNFLDPLTVQFANWRCRQITGLLMSKCASLNRLVWAGRQNNLGPNSREDREDYNLSRFPWSVSWPTRRGKSFRGRVTLAQ